MNCRDFQNEFEERATLSQTATLHLDSCADCRKMQFEQTRLWEMLSGLERVETPPDFNFQLKARIARAKPEEYKTGFFPAWRYILPMSFGVVLLSFVAWSGLYLVDQNSLADNASPNPAVNTSLPADSSFVEPNPTVSENQPPTEESAVIESANKQPEILRKTPAVAQNNKGGSRDLINKPPNVIAPNEKDPGGGSSDNALKQPKVFTPQGFDPNQKVETNVNSNITTIRIDVLLEASGIKTDSLKVISVGKDTLAERSGIKIGDVIEAVNGRKITGDSISGQKIDVETLTVLRDGKSLKINLRNK